MSASWDWRERSVKEKLTREQVEDLLEMRDNSRNKNKESKAERKRPTFVVRISAQGPSIAYWANSGPRHCAIIECNGFVQADGAKGLSVVDLLINLGLLDAPVFVSVTATTTSERVSSAAGMVGATVGNAKQLAGVLGGASDLVEAIAAASPVLRAVVGVVAKVAQMHVTVQINKRKAGVLIELVKSFHVPLAEVAKLQASGALDDRFAAHLEARLDALHNSMHGAEELMRQWCAQAGRSMLKTIKRHLAAGDFNRLFDESKEALRQSHELLCSDLSLKVATTLLGRASDQANAAVAHAGAVSKADLHNLESDLGALFSSFGKKLSDELKLLRWSLDGLHAMVAQMSAKQDQILALQETIILNQAAATKAMQELKETMVKSKEVANLSIRFEPALPFWRDVIVPKLETAGLLPWSLFASAIFCELLEPAKVAADDWNQIKERVKALFDKDGDGNISVFEYDKATFVQQQTLLDICLGLLEDDGKQSGEFHFAELVEDALLPTIRYPPLVKEQGVMVRNLFGAQSTQDEALLFAMSSVPRDWFAVSEDGVATPLADACETNRHWIAGSLRMPSPRLCVDLLRWLGFGTNGGSENASFLHVACGNAYVNTVVAVVQRWEHRNVAVSEGNDGALAKAMGRVAAFAKVSGVVTTGVQPLPSLAAAGTEQFDRVLVSLLCTSAQVARERFGALLTATGRLVVPIESTDAIEFVRIGPNSEQKTLSRVTERAEIAELQKLFPTTAPSVKNQRFCEYANWVVEAK
jgi:protein-L-isoaspartate O-methyltransferase